MRVLQTPDLLEALPPAEPERGQALSPKSRTWRTAVEKRLGRGFPRIWCEKGRLWSF